MPEHPIAHNAAVTHTSGTTTLHLLGPFPGGSLLQEITYQVITPNPNQLLIGAVLTQVPRNDVSTFANGQAIIDHTNITEESKPAHRGTANTFNGNRITIQPYIRLLAGSNYVLFHIHSLGISSLDLLIVMTARAIDFPVAPPPTPE